MIVTVVKLKVPNLSFSTYVNIYICSTPIDFCYDILLYNSLTRKITVKKIHSKTETKQQQIWEKEEKEIGF